MEEKKLDHLFVPAVALTEESEKLDDRAYSFWRSVFKEFFKKPGAIVSLVILFIVIFFTIFGPMFRTINTFGGSSTDVAYTTPNSRNLFGVDQYTKDVWTEVWRGCRTSLQIALIVCIINITVGLVVGSIWGYFKKIDPIMIEFRNFINNIPDLLLIILIMSIMSRTYWAMILALTITGWIGLASYVRNHIILITNTEFNIASRTLGTKSFKMIIHNILPYLLSIIVTVVAGMIPSAIGSEVGLTYLGLGLSPGKNTSLGTVLQTGFNSEFTYYPHVLFFPALVLALLTLSFFKMGMTLADACDPRNHR